MQFNGQRFLVVYSGVLTIAFVAAMLSGFAQTNKKLVVEELEVQRINVKEPDGTLRLIVSNAAKAPGIIIKAKEYPHPNRRVAGLIFFNDEGSENGGLIFGGEKTKDGDKRSFGHLSFDAYEQDQTMALNSQDGKEGRATKLQFTDYPTTPSSRTSSSWIRSRTCPRTSRRPKRRLTSTARASRRGGCVWPATPTAAWCWR